MASACCTSPRSVLQTRQQALESKDLTDLTNEAKYNFQKPWQVVKIIGQADTTEQLDLLAHPFHSFAFAQGSQRHRNLAAEGIGNVCSRQNFNKLLRIPSLIGVHPLKVYESIEMNPKCTSFPTTPCQPRTKSRHPLVPNLRHPIPLVKLKIWGFKVQMLQTLQLLIVLVWAHLKLTFMLFYEGIWIRFVDALLLFQTLAVCNLCGSARLFLS